MFIVATATATATTFTPHHHHHHHNRHECYISIKNICHVIIVRQQQRYAFKSRQKTVFHHPRPGESLDFWGPSEGPVQPAKPRGPNRSGSPAVAPYLSWEYKGAHSMPTPQEIDILLGWYIKTIYLHALQGHDFWVKCEIWGSITIN